MSATTNPRLARRMPLFAMVAIVMSLLGPMLTLAAPPPEDPPPSVTQCPDGMTWNDETQDCEPPPDIPTVDQNEPPDCPAGQVPNGNGGCIPDQQLPDCEQGAVLNPQTGECDPLPTLPPPPCPAGQVYDEQGNCVPEPNQQPACTDGTVLNEQTGECEPVEQAAPVPTEVPATDESTDNSPPPTGDEALIVNYKVCPFNVDLTTVSDFAGPEGCFGTKDGVTFELTSGGAVVDTQVTGSAGPSMVRFDDPPLGPLTLTEVSPRIGLTYAYCYENTSEGNTRPYGRMPISTTSPKSMPFELVSDEVVTCDWFVLGYTTVSVSKWLCPEGFDFASVSVEDWPATCSDPMDGVEFTLTDTAGAHVQTTAGGTAMWADIPPGSHTLTETVPAGIDPHTFVGCRVDDGDARTYEASGGVLSLPEMAEYTVIECDWYNVPAGDGEGRDIHLIKITCPIGYEPMEDSYRMSTECHEEIAPVEFTISGPGGYSQTQTATAGVTQRTTFANVPFGAIEISESVPPGSGEPRVFCTDPPPEGHGNYAPVDARGGSITIEHRADVEMELKCAFFNFLEDRYTITIDKFICPAGTDPALSVDLLGTTCTEPGNGIEFTFHDDRTGARSTRTVIDGSVHWDDIPGGPFSVTETVPAGYGEPVWDCIGWDWTGLVAESSRGSFVGAVLEGSAGQGPKHHDCTVYNFPNDERTLEVLKVTCPAGTDATETLRVFLECESIVDGVDFSLTDGAGTVTKSTAGGAATWTGVTPGEVTITEHTPPGYHDPVVSCSPLFGLPRSGLAGLAIIASLVPYTVTDSGITLELPEADYHWGCLFVNVEKGPAEVTVHKWTCPAGYDVDAPGADPTVDCTEVTDDIGFILEYPDHSGVLSVTGEHGPGTAWFGSLDPGAYVLTEVGLEASGNTAFTWDCTGTDIGAVHARPVNRGAVLTLDIAGGDAIVCEWYNVPPSEHVSLTVNKQQCSTPTFVDAVDCDTYEHGAEFELFALDPDTSLGTATTDAHGTATWTGLAPGRYRVDELDGEPCHVDVLEDATEVVIDETGEDTTITFRNVDPGDGTTVVFYNCASDTTTTTSTGKIPTDYPNTGAGPIDDAISPLMQDGTDAATPAASSDDFYEIACLDHPASTPVPETDCLRGAVPTGLTIDRIGVDAEIEVVEIVDGVMQPPSDPYLAAWYKETARLGEANNTVIAGHLNWWNVPEGVFYRLDDLEPGDRIAVTGDDGQIYVYEVQWVRLEPNDAPPALDVVGPTEAPSLTLISCGGEWDAAVAEYDHRTVVRAELIDVVPGDAAATTQSGRTS